MSSLVAALHRRAFTTYRNTQNGTIHTLAKGAASPTLPTNYEKIPLRADQAVKFHYEDKEYQVPLLLTIFQGSIKENSLFRIYSQHRGTRLWIKEVHFPPNGLINTFPAEKILP